MSHEHTHPFICNRALFALNMYIGAHTSFRNYLLSIKVLNENDSSLSVYKLIYRSNIFVFKLNICLPI